MVDNARDRIGGIDDAVEQGTDMVGTGREALGGAGDAVGAGDDLLGGDLLGGVGGSLEEASGGAADEGGGIIDKIKDLITGGDDGGR